MDLVANRTVVEQEVKRARRSRRGNQRNTVLLLRAAAQWHGPLEFTADDGGEEIRVTVAPCPTVLSVLAALGEKRAAGRYLVVLTPCDGDQVGKSVLARAIRPEVKPVNRWDLVQDGFGALRLDSLLLKPENQWVAEALLDAQPPGGWRRLAGPVLTRATALNRLAATRLGAEDPGDGTIDAAALLQWTTDPIAVADFQQLGEEERTGLTRWLTETAGAAADVVFRLAAPARITDAVPFGLAAAALYAGSEEQEENMDAGMLAARVRAEERYLRGNSPGPEALRTFGEAAESVIIRWTGSGGATDASNHAEQASSLCARAETILSQLAGDEETKRLLACRSQVLETGLDARLTTLGGAILGFLSSPSREAAALSGVEEALDSASKHGRARDHHAELAAARSAVRLTRWLAFPEEAPDTLADAATRMIRSWGWADRDLAVIEHPETSRVPRLADAYARLWREARDRRAGLDQAFVRKLVAWTGGGDATSLLCVENLLDRIARPLAAKRPPVIVALDGMSVAVATELADQITARGGWLEAGRERDGREPALATVPSVTAFSRTSLFAGALTAGGQSEERAGFSRFWGRRKSVLFHDADLAPEPGRPLAGKVRDAIADTSTVAGIVLNTIDDALDRGKQRDPSWKVEEVAYLGPVLDEALRAGRPVILTADHGHVLDHDEPLTARVGGEAAVSGRPDPADRHRSGTPEEGEVTVRGPRVLAEGGEVVAAVAEGIHYTRRKAGYHGGASPAEVVIPVITLMPSESLLPAGWFTYDRTGHAPPWWTAERPTHTRTGTVAEVEAKVTATAVATPGSDSRRRLRKSLAVPDEGDALFGREEVAPPAEHTPATGPATSIGAQVVGSPRMESQRQLIRRAPSAESVAALIDALIEAGNRVSVAEAALVVGEPPVRMSGYLSQVMRLLNVDGYPVLQRDAEGRSLSLSQKYLNQQFLGT